VRTDAPTEAALLEILERFCSGFAARDADGAIRLFAPDADVVMITSEQSLLRGPPEVSTFLHRYAQGTTRYSWTWDRRDAFSAGAVGWLLAEGTETAAGEHGEERHPYRMSMVFARSATAAGSWSMAPLRTTGRRLGPEGCPVARRMGLRK
jgi:hypothetical protein